MVRGWNAAREVGWWCLQLAECLLACFPAAWCCCSGCQCPQRSTATSARTRDPAGSSRCDSAGWCAHGPEQVEIDVPMCSGHALDAAATMGRGLVGCCKGRQWMRWGDLFKLSIKTRRQHARLKTWGGLTCKGARQAGGQSPAALLPHWWGSVGLHVHRVVRDHCGFWGAAPSKSPFLTSIH